MSIIDRIINCFVAGLLALLAAGCSDSRTTDEGCQANLLAGDLVVTEIMANPNGKDEGKEWFELYNATEKSIDLTGVTLVASKEDGSGKSDHVMTSVWLESRKYLVLGGVLPEAKPDFVDYCYSADLGSLRNTGGRILVKCNDVVIDKVVYVGMDDGKAQGFDGSQSPDAIANDNLDAWCEQGNEYEPGSFGTPGTVNQSCNIIPQGKCDDNGVLRDKVPPTPGDLVITELMANPAEVADPDGEWFEVYVDADVDLNGLLLGRDLPDDPDVQLPEGDCIHVSRGSYLLFARNSDPGVNGGLPAVEFVFDFSLLNSSGSLFVGFGTEVLDKVTYSSSFNGAATSLDPTMVDPDENDNQGYWCEAMDVYGQGDRGTPGAANPSCNIVPEGQCYDNGEFRDKVPPAPGDLVIAEFMANPQAVADDAGEWFEVYVTRDVDLNGLQLGRNPLDDPDMELPEGDCLHASAGRYLLFARGSDPGVNGGLPAVDFEFGFTLRNSGTCGLFVSYGGDLLDAISYSISHNGAATSLDPDYQDTATNDDPANWCEAVDVYGNGDQGTPGAANPSCGFVPEGQCRDGEELRDKVPPVLGDLVITEFMANPSGTDSGKEWFEVYVASDKDLDLNGLLLGTDPLDPDMRFPEGDCLTVAAHGYLVFAHNSDPAQNGGLPRVDFEFGFSLRNTGEGYLFVGYGAGDLDTITYTTSVSGASTSLDPDYVDIYKNDDPANWCEAVDVYGNGDQGTPGGANPSCGFIPEGQCRDGEELRDKVPPVLGDLVITEFMANPSGTDSGKEWFEVYVGSDKDLDLNGLLLGTDPLDPDMRLPEGECLTVAAHGYLVFAHNSDPAQNGGLPQVDFEFGFSLRNTGEGYLFAGFGEEVIDAITYTTTVSGAATSLDPAHLDPTANDNPDNWCEAVDIYGDGDLGTPGAANPDCP